MIILIRPHYFASASPRMVRDDSICHYYTKLTYSVHIWHKLCGVWVRDLYVPLCTLATGRGVHISSTGKGHTKQRSRTSTRKKNFFCVLCRGENHARAQANKQTRETKFLVCLCLRVFLCVLVCCSSAALLLLFDLRLHLHHLRLRLHLRLKTNVLIVVLL